MTKERVTTLLSIILLAFTYLPIAQAADIITNQKRIVLDPGHGNNDTGLVSPSGIQEQQITLELAEMIARELPDTFRTHLTRDGSGQTGTAMGQRSILANQTRANLFVSIHLQQTRSKTPLIFYSPMAPTAPLAGQMAQITAKLFNTRQNIQARIIKGRIIPLEGLLMPGILIEPMPISQLPENPEDREKFLIPYAQTIAAAILHFFSTGDLP